MRHSSVKRRAKELKESDVLCGEIKTRQEISLFLQPSLSERVTVAPFLFSRSLKKLSPSPSEGRGTRVVTYHPLRSRSPDDEETPMDVYFITGRNGTNHRRPFLPVPEETPSDLKSLPRRWNVGDTLTLSSKTEFPSSTFLLGH